MPLPRGEKIKQTIGRMRGVGGGGGQPMIRSAALATLCSLAFARADAEANQTVREDVGTLSMTAL